MTLRKAKSMIGKENVPLSNTGPKKKSDLAVVCPFKEDDVNIADEVTAEVKIPQMRTNEKLSRTINTNLSKFSQRVASSNPFTVTKQHQI